MIIFTPNPTLNRTAASESLPDSDVHLRRCRLVWCCPKTSMPRIFSKLVAISAMAGAIGAYAEDASTPAQTNSPCLPRKLFSCPIPTFEKAPKEKAASTRPVDATADVEVQSPNSQDQAERYHWINGHDLLSCPIRTEEGGAYGWVKKNLFAPETIQLKRASMSGSLVPTFKRRNPLCLLRSNQFLSIDW
jgi:hypothetical protein